MDIDYHYVCFHCLRCLEAICRTLCIIIMIGYPSSFISNSNYDGRIGTYRLEMLYAAATTDACETLDWTNMLQTRSGKGRITNEEIETQLEMKCPGEGDAKDADDPHQRYKKLAIYYPKVARNTEERIIQNTDCSRASGQRFST